MEKTDKYGNNTNFPDSVMSDITTKGLLGKLIKTSRAYPIYSAGRLVRTAFSWG